jgi:hypothetical protein
MSDNKSIRYRIEPDSIENGERWISIIIKNSGKVSLTKISARLNSLDTNSIEVKEPIKDIPILVPGKELKLYYPIIAKNSGEVYFCMDGVFDDELFYLESNHKKIKVGAKSAELLDVFVFEKEAGKVKCTATIKANKKNEELNLEFWSESPQGVIEEIDSIKINNPKPGQNHTYSAYFVPRMQGIYSIQAYLYDKSKRLGYKSDNIMVGRTSAGGLRRLNIRQ